MRPAGRPGISTILDGTLKIGEYPTPDDVEEVLAPKVQGLRAILDVFTEHQPQVVFHSGTHRKHGGGDRLDLRRRHRQPDARGQIFAE